jgi:hypothetical protein
MRTFRIARIGLALGILASLAVGPTAARGAEPCKDDLGNLVFNEVQQWVKAPSTKLGNLGGFDQGDYPTWNGTAPTQSVQAGAGGGSIATRAPLNATGSEYDPRGSGHFEGKFTGCIDKIAWDMFLLSPIPPLAGGITTELKLIIDGTQTWLTPGDPGPSINTTSEGTTGALYRLRFVFTGIYNAMNLDPQSYAPLEGEHTIQLTLFPQFVNDPQGAYVYDTTEAPSSLTFNKKTGLSAYTKLDQAA